MISEQPYKQKITLGQSGNALVLLIAICLILFVGLAFMKAVWYFRFEKELALPLFNKNIMGLFVLPADTDNLLYKPWTLLTHMFVHDNVWKVFANMLWLGCFGYILQDMTGNRKIAPVFIYGGLGGGIAFILACNFLPSLQAQIPYAVSVGAGASVMAVAIVTAMVSPSYRLFPMIGGGLPLWVLTAFYILTALLTTSFSDPAPIIVTLGGALTGFLYMLFFRAGYDWGGWMNRFFDWSSNLFTPAESLKQEELKEELFYKTTVTPYTRTPNITQQRVDEILDKIHQKGFNSLSEDEKTLLSRASKEGI